MKSTAKMEDNVSDLGDPEAEGYDAFLDGKSETDNPYDNNTDEHLSWNDGWMRAAEESGAT